MHCYDSAVHQDRFQQNNKMVGFMIIEELQKLCSPLFAIALFLRSLFL